MCSQRLVRKAQQRIAVLFFGSHATVACTEQIAQLNSLLAEACPFHMRYMQLVAEVRPLLPHLGRLSRVRIKAWMEKLQEPVRQGACSSKQLPVARQQAPGSPAIALLSLLLWLDCDTLWTSCVLASTTW